MQWGIQGKGPGGGPHLLLDYTDAWGAESFLNASASITSGSGSANDVESVPWPSTLMKAAVYENEMQLTFKIIFDIAR